MISVDGNGTVLPVKLKLRRIALIKILKKKNFKKDLMNLIETNHHINIASDHSVSSNNSFKSFLNAESFNMVLTLLQLCEAP